MNDGCVCLEIEKCNIPYACSEPFNIDINLPSERRAAGAGPNSMCRHKVGKGPNTPDVWGDNLAPGQQHWMEGIGRRCRDWTASAWGPCTNSRPTAGKDRLAFSSRCITSSSLPIAFGTQHTHTTHSTLSPPQSPFFFIFFPGILTKSYSLRYGYRAMYWKAVAYISRA